MRALLRLLNRLEEGFLAVLLLGMISLAVLQIVLRNGFNMGIYWGDDAVRTLVLWITMIGAMVAVGRGQHIRIDLLDRLLPGKVRGPVTCGVDLVTAALCGSLAWYGWEFTMLEYVDGLVAFGSVPSWLTVAVIPFAFSVMGLRYLRHAILGRPALIADAVGAAGPR